jgi:2-polyprenyl-3-methyl-5-hydroxy-6-metoxy-1,4-benzoquinol methylase
MRLQVLDVNLRGFHSAPLYLDEQTFEHVATCPACTSGDGQQLIAASVGQTQDGLHLSHCPSCNHTYLSRRPTQVWFQQYYATEWDTGRTPEPVSPVRTARARLQHVGLARRAVHAARVLRTDVPRNMYPGPARLLQMVSGLGHVAGDSFPRGSKLLEIGTGYGAALEFFTAAGLETYGTEASAHRVAACRAKGLRVTQTSILDLNPVAPHGPFDFVYSQHVFEHLTDLDQVMKSVEPLVKPGGFVYIEVPHSPLAEDVVLRSHIPVHIHLFSAASLSTLLQRSGFRPVRVLADVNLHVVAQKGEVDTPLADVHIPSRPDDLVHGLRQIVGEGAVRVRYDQYHVEITRERDGSRVFTRPFPYGNNNAVDGDCNEFVLRADDSDLETWPLRFVHDTPRAPIWVK